MKDVLITINSIQNLDGEDRLGPELITQGTYDYASDGARFSYMESELTGLDGTKTQFHIRPDEVVMSRRGAVNAQLVFHKGENNRFLYHTPYGALTMGVNTHRLEWRMDEHGGEMEIEYDLDVETSHISRNKFKINVREKGLKS